MPLKAVLFDMDGVIVDTEPLQRKAYHETFKYYRMQVSDAEYSTFLGKSTKEVCSNLVERHQLNVTAEEFMKRKRAYFKDFFDHDPDFDLIPGVKELIMDYHKNGLKLVLATSASRHTIHEVFDRFKIEEFFHEQISGDELQHSKPDPEIFLLAAKLSGEDKKNCMVIEDSTNGIKAANNAGIFVCGFKSPHSIGQDYSTAQKVITDFGQIRYENSREWFLQS